MNGAYNQKQLAALEEMKKACAECDRHIDTLEKLGVDVSDRRATNDFRKMGCQRCEEIHQAAKLGALS